MKATLVNFKKKLTIAASFMLAVIVIVAAIDSNVIVSALSVFGKKELPIYSVEVKEKKIAISFDCAWGVEFTDKILEEVERFKIKCTFFSVQFWTEKHADYVKKIDEAGHEIGTHSATHSHMSKLSETQIIDELTSSSQAITKITGKKVTLFRPPFGEYNDRLIKVSRAQGLEVIQWDVDSHDWMDLSAEQIAMRVISRVKNGSIILCHNNALHTAEALPLIFADLLQKGYKFVPIGDLIIKGNYQINNNGRQHADS